MSDRRSDRTNSNKIHLKPDCYPRLSMNEIFAQILTFFPI